MTERLIPLKLQFFAVAFSLVLLLFIIELIRKNKLKEGYSILWFAMGLSLLIISVWTDLLKNVSYLIGVEYEPAMLFAVLVLGIIVLMIHFSVLVSGFDKQNKTLAQNTGLLYWEIKQLREELKSLQEAQSEASAAKEIVEN
ncbi:MAG: DUF2304 domain-containing protein [bacterium]